MRVLVADDEPLIRRSLEKILRRFGHEVVLAEDGRQALDLSRRQPPDAFILDVLMPGLTGPEVLAELGHPRSVPVILMSAFTGDYRKEMAESLGADLFVEKPFDSLEDLVHSLERLREEKLK